MCSNHEEPSKYFEPHFRMSRRAHGEPPIVMAGAEPLPIRADLRPELPQKHGWFRDPVECRERLALDLLSYLTHCDQTALRYHRTLANGVLRMLPYSYVEIDRELILDITRHIAPEIPCACGELSCEGETVVGDIQIECVCECHQGAA